MWPHLFMLWFNDVKCTKVLFFIDFIAAQKKKIILGENQIVKRKIFMCEISLIFFWFAKN